MLARLAGPGRQRTGLAGCVTLSVLAVLALAAPWVDPARGNSAPRASVDAGDEAEGAMEPARRTGASAKPNQAVLDEWWGVSIAHRRSAFALPRRADGFPFTVDDMAVLESASLER